jgi:pilus assembly protein CpaF
MTALADAVRRRLAVSAAEPTAENVAAALRDERGLADGHTVLQVIEELRRETTGFGPLDALLAAEGVTDVLVNGTEGVFVDRGRGPELTAVTFDDAESVRRLAQRLAAVAGRRLDHASPWVDARLPGGIRLHAVLAPIARPGPTISLRVVGAQELSLDGLVGLGALPQWCAQSLRALVAAKVAFVVSGGTGTGKTTLLSALLGECPDGERLVVVEDSSELRPAHPHVVALEARPPNVEGAGRVTMRDLVRQALRMRPDRLVVGEVRGAEVVDLLAALNTGHEGGCGTIHANSAGDVPARFEALAVAAGLSRQAVHSQLAAGLRVVIHLTRDVDGRRRLAEVGLLARQPDGIVTSETAFRIASDRPRADTAWARWEALVG